MKQRLPSIIQGFLSIYHLLWRSRLRYGRTGADIWAKQWLLRMDCSIQGGGEAVGLFDWDQHEQSIRQRRGMTTVETWRGFPWGDLWR